MSIRVYNNNTQKWEKQATMIASSLKVNDIPGNYVSDNVEDCFQEINKDIVQIKSDVKYIYENGTIGGGGSGGGGSSMPEVTVDGLTEYIVNSTQIIDIYYYFRSPNPGYGVAQLTYGNEIERVEIPQARNRWTVGPFPRGKHELTIAVEDKQGFWTAPAKITVISGAIEVTTDFNDSKDFTLNDNILIPFSVHSSLPDVLVDLTFNGKTETRVANIGANEWHLGKLPFMGVSTAKIKAHTKDFASNELKFNLVAADSDSLFVSTSFNQETIQEGQRLMLDYRISMKNQYNFDAELWLDGNLFATVKAKPGVNFWDVGNNLELGIHNLKVVARTIDGLKEAQMELKVEVVSAGFEPFRPVDTGLIAEFNANGKLNNSSDKGVWKAKNDENMIFTLHNFNYVTNGWLENSLHFNGKTYAEIDYAPLKDGIKTGFTIEVFYKVSNVGDIDGNVINFKNPNTPFQGLSVDTQIAMLSTKDSVIASSQFQEGVWTRQTWTIDRATRTLKLYTNAVLSNVAYLEPNDVTLDHYDDEFKYGGNIILGAKRNENGEIVNNSSSHIKVIRIYNRPLTSEEVLQNHIADIRDREEQLAIRELNYGEETIPVLKMFGNLENFGEGEERIIQIDYNDPKDPAKRIVKDGCLVSWQGTSSRDYPVKNYTIKLREGGLPMISYAPKDGWLGEDRWTLKANYMDSSHANNVGTNKFVHDFFKPYPYPSQVADPTTRANVDGFPIKLVINNEEKGLYTWNIDRYAPHNYGFINYDENNLPIRHPNAVSYEVGVNSTSGAGAFWDTSWESIRSEFKHRYNFRGEEDFVTEMLPPNQKVLALGKHNELVELVTWVSNCTDAEFYAECKEHFSVRHLIDYYLIVYTLGMVD